MPRGGGGVLNKLITGILIIVVFAQLTPVALEQIGTLDLTNVDGKGLDLSFGVLLIQIVVVIIGILMLMRHYGITI